MHSSQNWTPQCNWASWKKLEDRNELSEPLSFQRRTTEQGGVWDFGGLNKTLKPGHIAHLKLHLDSLQLVHPNLSEKLNVQPFSSKRNPQHQWMSFSHVLKTIISLTLKPTPWAIEQDSQESLLTQNLHVIHMSA